MAREGRRVTEVSLYQDTSGLNQLLKNGKWGGAKGVLVKCYFGLGEGCKPIFQLVRLE